MDITDIDSFLSKKGQFASILYEKEIKQLKGSPGKVTKKVRLTGRAGINYENLSSVIEGRENGDLPAESAGLPWGEWHKFPYVIKNKDQYYLRLTLGANTKPQVEYFLDGKPVDKGTALIYALASEKKSPDDVVPVVNIKLENILEIN